MALGRFITLEGGEGGGKTTNLELIKELLRQRGISFQLTREPGGTPFAEEIREILLRKREEKVATMSEVLLMFAARAQHVEQHIKPLLEQGVWVISDRFTDASFAYQGGGRELEWEIVEKLEELAINGFSPDKTLLLDLDPEIGLERAAKRAEFDRFESEEAVFFKRVRAAYLRRVAEHPERFIVIDAAQNLASVQSDLKKALNSWLDEVVAK